MNNLKLNDEKTEVLHITSRFCSRLQLPTIKVDNSPIVPSDKVKNLGVIFDRHMVMDRFVSLTCKSPSFQLHRLGKIRQYLDTTTAKKLVQALVLCHLYPFQTGLIPCSPQTRVWGEQWMTFLGNPYVNTRYGQYALSYRLLISAYVTVATCLG